MPIIRRMSVVLPDPDSPMMPREAPLYHVQIEQGEGSGRAIMLFDAAQFEEVHISYFPSSRRRRIRGYRRANLRKTALRKTPENRPVAGSNAGLHLSTSWCIRRVDSATHPSVRPSSTISPWRITIRRWAVCAASAMSWVIMSRGTVLLRCIHHQIHDTPLDGGVEGSGRDSICNQQGRLTAHRHGDHHALALPARELMRKTLHDGFRQADAACQLPGSGTDPSAQAPMLRQGRHYLLFNAQHGFSAVCGSWKTSRSALHGYFAVALHRSHNLRTAEESRASHLRRRRQQASIAKVPSELARAGFPDQAHALTGRDTKGDAVDHRGTGKRYAQVAHFQHHCSPTTRASRRPSPRILNPTMTTVIAVMAP